MRGELPTKIHYFLLKTKFFFSSGLSLVAKFDRVHIAPFFRLYIQLLAILKEEDTIEPIIIINSRTKTQVLQDIVDLKCYEILSRQDPKVKA